MSDTSSFSIVDKCNSLKLSDVFSDDLFQYFTVLRYFIVFLKNGIFFSIRLYFFICLSQNGSMNIKYNEIINSFETVCLIHIGLLCFFL